MIRAPAFLLAIGLVYGATFFVADALRFEPVKDEIHFLESSRRFAVPFDGEALRSYPEVVTPLSLIAWGALERLTGSGLWAGRALNLVLSFALVCLVAFSAPVAWPRGALAATGLLLFPYTLPLSVHLYTDLMGAALATVGTFAVVKRRPALAFFSLTAAIATRQYLVQISAALLATEALAWVRGDSQRWKTAAATAAASATLVAWILFFGGLAPRAGLDVWAPRYPAPMLDASFFIVHYGLYALVGIGAYFVVVEAVLFRELPTRDALANRRNLIAAAVLVALFLIDPPVLTSSHQGGPIGRVSRMLLPAPDYDVLRVALFYPLALLGMIRFSGRLDAAFWIVTAGVVLSMKQQLPWEKYLLPTLSSLWLLRAVGALPPYGRGSDRSAATSNGFTKQSSPTPRLST
jgi:hypothetical protein